jgi:hypothetical protein
MRTIKDSEFLPASNKPLWGSVGYLRVNIYGFFNDESIFCADIRNKIVCIEVPENPEWMPIYNADREPKGLRRLLLKLRMIWKIIKTK